MADEQLPTVEVTVSNSNDEPLSEVVDEIVEEETTSDDVAIAAIEANRDIELATINAEVERERIEAITEQVEANENKEIEECREEIKRLTEVVEELGQRITLLTPPLQLVEETVTEQSETAPETNLTQPSTAAPTVETMTELGEESAAENQEAEETVIVHERRYIPI